MQLQFVLLLSLGSGFRCSGLVCLVCISFKTFVWGIFLSNLFSPDNRGLEKQQLIVSGRLKGREIASAGREFLFLSFQ